MKIPFSPPYIDNDVINEVVDSLQSGWITTGPKVKALEEEIKNYTQAQQVLCVNSWTSGAIMMLRWLGIKAGDEVIVPAYTYSATALAVIHAGGIPVIVDVDDDFNISISGIEQAITNKTKAIIPVDFAGYPCDYYAINQLVNKESIKKHFIATSDVQQKLGRILVLNDAAHSLGANYRSNLKTGSETDIAIFSLHAVKNMTTAEGGAICLNLPVPFNNDELYSQLRQMSLNCQTKDAFSKSRAGSWRYDITGLGMKINMADVNAAIGLAQFRKYGILLQRRQYIFNKYSEILSKYDWTILPPYKNIDGRLGSCHLYALRIKGISETQRDLIIEEISKKDIAVNVHFIPLPMLSYFKSLGYDISNYPNAFDNYQHEISLPIYPQLTDEQIEVVCTAIITSYESVI